MSESVGVTFNRLASDPRYGYGPITRLSQSEMQDALNLGLPLIGKTIAAVEWLTQEHGLDDVFSPDLGLKLTFTDGTTCKITGCGFNDSTGGIHVENYPGDDSG